MPQWLDDPSELQAAAALLSLLVTLVLAGLTWVYVKHTRRMADQMAQQSEPVVVGRIEPFGNLYAQFVLTNVGLGPALDVELELEVDHRSVWRDSLLEAGKSEHFFVPVEGGVSASTFKGLGEAGKVLSGKFVYLDRGRRRYGPFDVLVDFKQLNADWDEAHWQLRKSEMLQHADEVSKALGELTKETKTIAATLKAHLPPLTTPTGLAVSVTALRNLRSSLAGSDQFVPMDPVSAGHEAIAEVLGVDRQTAFRIWNHCRGHSGVSDLSEIEGVSSELASSFRRFFQMDEPQA